MLPYNEGEHARMTNLVTFVRVDDFPLVLLNTVTGGCLTWALKY